jgi:hypothetical protein
MPAMYSEGALFTFPEVLTILFSTARPAASINKVPADDMYHSAIKTKKKLCGLSPPVNYTD